MDMSNQRKIESLQHEINSLRNDVLSATHVGPEYTESRTQAIDEALDELSYTLSDEKALRDLDQHLPG